MSSPFPGTLFDGQTLATTPVTLAVGSDRISSLDETTVPPVPLSAIRVSHRLGNTPRYLYLPDGRTVETPDNAAVDALLAGQRRGRLVALVHALETHSRAVAAATVLLVATLGATLWWGLPVLARQIAMAVPEGIEDQAGRSALAAINKMLGPSNLSKRDRDRVTEQARRLAKVAGLAKTPEVAFRSMGGQFPNAFALPGGIIVVSDEIVRLATEDELAAVLAHEIGHWQYRHGMQSVLRGSTALLVVSAVSGDLSALTTFAGTIPFMLLQRGYSREFESQADAYAVDLMKRAGIGIYHFASILRKLEGSRPQHGQDLTYLSTHPGTADRIAALGPLGAPPPNRPAAAASTKEGDLVAPEALVRAAPQYPADLGPTGVSGQVLVEFTVGTDGNVSEARILRSDRKEFEAPALAAIRQWQFAPGRREGKTAATRVIQLLEFRPNQPAEIPPATAARASETPLDHYEVLPRIIRRKLPRYPQEMKDAHLSGQVTIEFIIDKNGDVRAPRVIQSSHKEFEAPAIAAVSEWIFSPARLNGEPVESHATQLLEFNSEE